MTMYYIRDIKYNPSRNVVVTTVGGAKNVKRLTVRTEVSFRFHLYIYNSHSRRKLYNRKLAGGGRRKNEKKWSARKNEEGRV